jgi:hypothetical protein
MTTSCTFILNFNHSEHHTFYSIHASHCNQQVLIIAFYSTILLVSLMMFLTLPNFNVSILIHVLCVGRSFIGMHFPFSWFVSVLFNCFHFPLFIRWEMWLRNDWSLQNTGPTLCNQLLFEQELLGNIMFSQFLWKKKFGISCRKESISSHGFDGKCLLEKDGLIPQSNHGF